MIIVAIVNIEENNWMTLSSQQVVHSKSILMSSFILICDTFFKSCSTKSVKVQVYNITYEDIEVYIEARGEYPGIEHIKISTCTATYQL